MKCFVLVFLAAVPFVNGQILVGCDAAYGWFTCGRRYIFPDTFDVHKLPNGTGNVELGVNEGLPSILKDTFVPIPPRPNLKHLRLVNFAYDNNQSIPISSFLSENKNSLQILEIKSGVLRNLDQETFKGFSDLGTLILWDTGLAAVAVDSFSALTDGTNEPLLHYVTISSDAITRLDYSVFAPVSRTIRLENRKRTRQSETRFSSCENGLVISNRVTVYRTRICGSQDADTFGKSTAYPSFEIEPLYKLDLSPQGFETPPLTEVTCHFLQTLKLTGMFKNLFVSQPFTFARLYDLDLENSQLVDLPSSVLETMNNVSLTRLMMTGVPVCTADRACRSCCNLDTLLRWLEPGNGLVFRFQCGRGYACGNQLNPPDDCLEYYREENVRDLIDSNLCVSTPTTAGTNWSSTIPTTAGANWSTTNMTEAPGSTTTWTTTSTTRIPNTTLRTMSSTPSPDAVVLSCANGVVTVTVDDHGASSATFNGDGSTACRDVLRKMVAAALPGHGPANGARGVEWTVVLLIASSAVAARRF